MDSTLAPVLAALLAHADVKPGERVLDIGCGTGASVMALGEGVGRDGQVVGLDISRPLLDLARKRIGCQPHIRLELGDAATYPFPPAEMDLLFSRFGVMFFGDPKAAFRNMRAAMSEQGRVCFACWQESSANPWVDIPQSRIESFLPERSLWAQGIVGPFSFANTGRVTDILTSTGFRSPAFTPFEFPVLLGQTLDEAVERCCAFGATGRMLEEQSEQIQRRAAEAVREALREHVTTDGAVALPGQVWIVSARIASP